MPDTSYFLGLDIGTDSVGYAVTNEQYELLRFHGERMWGATLFDPAGTNEERRKIRTSRRRLHRRQHRIQMLKEIFAEEIAKIDPLFYQRIEDSWKLAKDKTNQGDLNAIFNDSKYTDKDFHKAYPTIHHLICELMDDDSVHDIRLVYLACAWFMAHRGHFFSELSVETLLNGGSFDEAYDGLLCLFDEEIDNRISEYPDEQEYGMWNRGTGSSLKESLLAVMQSSISISKKEEEIKKILILEDGKRELYPLKLVIKLLAGGKVSLQKLFGDSCEEESVSLDMDDDGIDSLIMKLGENGELIRLLKQLYDSASLVTLLQGQPCISKAKIEIYNKHKDDLHGLKKLLWNYIPENRGLYRRIFSDPNLSNYPAYISESRKNTSNIELNAFLKKEVLPVLEKCEINDAADKSFYQDMISRIELNAFLPKQVSKDNRTIPYQLYEAELRIVLKNAKKYLPFLNECKDGCKITEADKILSIFSFRTPYYVGPQVKDSNKKYSPYAWLKRKSDEPVRPWNIEEVIDTNASELAFINGMVNNCTYCPWETVLPMYSLLYQRFVVLNEINNLRVRGEKISVADKQGIYYELFEKHKKVTRLQILNYLKKSIDINLVDDDISGIDIKINSSLSSYHAFRYFLDNNKLTEDEVEQIIYQRSCTEDSVRFGKWLEKQLFAVKLDDKEKKIICRIFLKDFGRLSSYFLSELGFENKTGLQKGSVIQLMWETNDNLNELLSDKYTLSDILEHKRKEYYEQHPLSFEEKLDELYLSTAVKRQIYRTKDIVDSVIHAMGGKAPKRIFVEMARGAKKTQKNQRTESRRDQLIEKLKHVKDQEVKLFRDALEEEGIQNRLQGDKLYLWFMQLGKCPYCGKPIPLSSLYNKDADIDHIYPQCLTKDDSIIDNKVLAHKNCNGNKTDIYPLPVHMIHQELWKYWKDNDLISQEKYYRLSRRTPLTDDEKQKFIKRQLVETQQTTKAVLNLLKERFPETEVVAVKAGLISDYRHEIIDMPKCRTLNDLHHAKDAYLNIAVGNVYNEIFSKNFFIDRTNYSMKTETIFKGSHYTAKGQCFWKGSDDIANTKKVLADNHVHLTKYQISKTDGQLFDINIVSKGKGQIQRKKDQPLEDYGGYNKPSMAGFVMVSYCKGKKGKEVSLLPIALDGRDIFLEGKNEQKTEYIRKLLNENGIIADFAFPIGLRLLRIGTMFSFNGLRMVIAGRTGDQIVFRVFSATFLEEYFERYIKRIESFIERKKTNQAIVLDPEYTKINQQTNQQLYDELVKKMSIPMFYRLFKNQVEFFDDFVNKEYFSGLSLEEQVKVLSAMLSIIKTNRAGAVDLTLIKGKSQAATIRLSNSLSSWNKNYTDVRLIDTDAAGLFEKQSGNLLDYLK